MNLPSAVKWKQVGRGSLSIGALAMQSAFGFAMASGKLAKAQEDEAPIEAKIDAFLAKIEAWMLDDILELREELVAVRRIVRRLKAESQRES